MLKRGTFTINCNALIIPHKKFREEDLNKWKCILLLKFIYNNKFIAKFPITTVFIAFVILGPPAANAADKPNV